MVDDAINMSDIFSYRSVFQKAGLIAINYIRQKFLDTISDGFSCDLIVSFEKSYWSPVLQKMSQFVFLWQKGNEASMRN